MQKTEEMVSPQELFNTPTEDIAASIQSIKADDKQVNTGEQHVDVQEGQQQNNLVQPEYDPSSAKEIIKEESKFDFDSELSSLEEEFGLKKKEELDEISNKEDNEELESESEDDKIAKERLERDEKMINIIKELDQANRKSLKRVSELEVQLDNAATQAELYKKQAYTYYEELRANEFDRSKFVVDDEAKNFVHYFNEYKKNSENVQAKNGALREAISIVNKITGRDLSNYLMDYFTLGNTDISAIPGGTSMQTPNFNVGPNRAKSEDDRKMDAISQAFESL